MIDIKQPFTIAKITIYPRTDEISCDGERLEIKSMSMQLICYFAAHNDEVISRDQLRESLWDNSKASDHTINNHLYRLRQIFTKLDSKTKYIHTVTGNKSGYRLLAPVTQDLSGVIETPKNKVSPDIEDTNQQNELKTDSTSTIKPKPSKNIDLIKIFFISALILCSLIIFQFITSPSPNYMDISPLTNKLGREQNPAISQDGSLLLFANRTSRNSTWELYAARLSSSADVLEESKIFNAKTNNDNYVSISPNKKLIAFIRYPKNERGIYLADFDEHSLTASNERKVISLKSMNLSPAISWLNDTQFFYTITEAISAPRKVFSYNLENSHSEQITAPPLNTYGDFAAVVSPNKHWLAIMRADRSYGYNLFLYDLKQKNLITTPVNNTEERLNVSFSDDSKKVFFINQQGFLSSFDIKSEEIKTISSIKHPGYWPLKIPGKDQFITQQDWGLSSLTNKVIKISNPQTGGNGTSRVVIDNGLSNRAITGIANNGLIFASFNANQQIELWKYQNGKSSRLKSFNNTPRYKSALSLDWLKGSDKALLSINNTCHLIDIKTGKDTPLCPANETLYAGRFSKNGQSIYLAGLNQTHSPSAVKMGLSGFPMTPINPMSNANSIHEGDQNSFYYSVEPSFDIYHYNEKLGINQKIIDRTFIIGRFSNNDFTVTTHGIYFMDRKQIRKNAIYFYHFDSKKIDFVIASKDNYPHFVLSEDEKSIYLIQSYDSNTHLSLLKN